MCVAITSLSSLAARSLQGRVRVLLDSKLSIVANVGDDGEVADCTSFQISTPFSTLSRAKLMRLEVAACVGIAPEPWNDLVRLGADAWF